MLTVVVLNWARPDNVLRNLIRYSSYNIVRQILCFNNGPRLEGATALPSKCVLVEASHDLGLYTRFAIATLSATDAIFHTDDDVGVPASTMEALYENWRRSPLICHGLYGRSATDRYVRGNVFGAVEVVLTRALICGARINLAALAVRRQFDDLICEPSGNGEDIVLSFAAMSLAGTRNRAYRLQAEDYPDEIANGRQPVSIHNRWSGHYDHRTRVVERCRAVFSLTLPVSSPNSAVGAD
jgi:hypothetical protein